DIDIRGSGVDAQVAVRAVEAAAKLDLADGLEFTAQDQPTQLAGLQTGGYMGFKVRFTVTLGGQHFAYLSVDVVVGREPSGHVQRALYPLPFDIPGIGGAAITVYP